MGAMKRMFYDENPCDDGCQCSDASRMDELCPVCLAEYEENMMANYEELEANGMVMTEAQYEREIEMQLEGQDRTEYYSKKIEQYLKKQGA